MKKLIFFLIYSLILAVSIFSQSEIVKIGVYENEPLVFLNSEGKYDGLAIQILEYIAGQEDWELEFVPGSWDECLERLENAEIDIQVGIAKTEERKAIYDFSSQAVFTAWGQVYSGSDVILESILDSEGLTFAIYHKSYLSEQFKILLANFDITAEFLELEGYDEMVSAIERGQADAGVFNRTFGENYFQGKGLIRTPIVFNPVRLHYGFPKNTKPGRIAIVDQHLHVLKSDNNSIYFRYLNQIIGQETVSVIPEWLKLVIYGILILFILLMLLTFIMRRQIRIATAELTSSLNEKEVLIKEIHHRVKNNLNTITSLINLKAMSIKHEETVSILKQLDARIMSMAFVHEQLYNSAGFSNINMSKYIDKLVKNIFEGIDPDFCSLNLNGIEPDIVLNVDKVIPLGLILNEVVYNSIKHAFTGTYGGEIQIKLKQLDNSYLLTAADNGRGLPDEYKMENSNKLGMQLIISLSEQIDARFTIKNENGTHVEIEFPKV